MGADVKRNIMDLKALVSNEIFSQIHHLDGKLWYMTSDNICKFNDKPTAGYLRDFLNDKNVAFMYERHTKFDVWNRKILKREIKYFLNIHFMMQPINAANKNKTNKRL